MKTEMMKHDDVQVERRIDLSSPHLGRDERDLVVSALDENWVGPLGPYVDGFEQDMVRYIGVEAAVALSSGTAALHLALIVSGVGPGDTVLCSDLTFAASANPIVYCGAQPVFVDCSRESWCLDADLLEEELEQGRRSGRRVPKALITVDLYGQTADYDRIAALCQRYGVVLIEDAAEALGSTYRGRKAGSFGSLGVLSFNGNKIITTGGGGMLLSDDAAKINRARFLATQARDPAPHYEHSVIGYNYRMSSLSGALGRGQLRVIEERVSARRRNFATYEAAFRDVPGISMMPEPDYGRSNRWLTCIQVDPGQFGASREEIRVALQQAAVEARPLWKPMHMQPIFRDARVVGGRVSEGLFAHGLCLPSGSNLTDSDVRRVIDAVLAMRK